jgi:hypothetical protein
MCAFNQLFINAMFVSEFLTTVSHASFTLIYPASILMYNQILRLIYLMMRMVVKNTVKTTKIVFDFS